MTVAIISGGAMGVWDERVAAVHLLRALGIRPVFIAVNAAGVFHPEELDHWATVHNENFAEWKAQRKANGLPRAGIHWGLSKGDDVEATCRTPGFRGGSSGLFGVDVALHGVGCDGAILCGIPMDEGVNQFSGKAWAHAHRFRAGWERARVIEVIQPRVRSFRGWTRHLLGKPTVEWLRGLG